jgi:hypothetical protein
VRCSHVKGTREQIPGRYLGVAKHSENPLPHLLAGVFTPLVGTHSKILIFRDVLIRAPGKFEPSGFASVYQTPSVTV